MNYDTVSGKNQLYSMGTDKADSWCRMELLDDVPRPFTILRLDALCV